MDSRENAGPGDVTRLLRSARTGDAEALNDVVHLVYQDLRRLARRELGREWGDREVQPTALVHEAYLKLASGGGIEAADRVHFLAIAARAMRQVLVDHARRRRTAKRGDGWSATTLSGRPAEASLDPDEVLALDAALDRLEPRQRQIVELRFFAGLEEMEIAEALNVSDRTVRREWVKARAWLYRELYAEVGDP